jgi:hypothetical protein
LCISSPNWLATIFMHAQYCMHALLCVQLQFCSDDDCTLCSHS